MKRHFLPVLLIVALFLFFTTLVHAESIKDRFDPLQYHTAEEMERMKKTNGVEVIKFFVFPDGSAISWMQYLESGVCFAYALAPNGLWPDGRVRYRIIHRGSCKSADDRLANWLEQEEADKRKKGI